MKSSSVANSFSWLPPILGFNSGLEALRLDGVEFREVRFANGDSYTGGWRDDHPEGEGRYVWTDGSCYEGSWSAGQCHGWGAYTWPDAQAQYLGEWQHNRLHGYGTFTSADGSKYQGSWADGAKHGLGTQTHANGDRFEGVWVGGAARGPGRYVFVDGGDYDGDWLDGAMHGKGTFKWPGGRYDGEWAQGLQEGVGVFTWPDGSTYEGFWVEGKRHGVGVLRPAAHANAQGGGRSRRHRSDDGGGPLVSLSAPASPRGEPEVGGVSGIAQQGDEAFAAAANATLPTVVYACEYRRGALVLQEALTQSDLELVLGPFARQASASGLHRGASMKRKARRRRGKDRLGETIYKGHRSFDLMLDLQLGIRYTLAALSKLPSTPTLLPMHFDEKVWLRFPREGCEITPPHPCADFKWKDYMPTVFRHLREAFGVSNSDYILSVCGDRALRELPSPGKSGSVFFVSQDERFLVKTMSKEEIALLLRSLPAYVAHVARHPDTLLTHFCGVHRVRPHGGRKVRFVVMNNIMRTDLRIHQRFDLKGSTYKRTAGDGALTGPGSVLTLKDLDLKERFALSEDRRRVVVDQLASDAGFLEKMGVMDYSLLLGVHYKGAHAEPSPTPRADQPSSIRPAAGWSSAGDESDAGAISSTQKQSTCAAPTRLAKSSATTASDPVASAYKPSPFETPETVAAAATPAPAVGVGGQLKKTSSGPSRRFWHRSVASTASSLEEYMGMGAWSSASFVDAAETLPGSKDDDNATLRNNGAGADGKVLLEKTTSLLTPAASSMAIHTVNVPSARMAVQAEARPKAGLEVVEFQIRKPAGPLGFRKFLAWRRDLQEKQRQKRAQNHPPSNNVVSVPSQTPRPDSPVDSPGQGQTGTALHSAHRSTDSDELSSGLQQNHHQKCPDPLLFSVAPRNRSGMSGNGSARFATPSGSVATTPTGASIAAAAAHAAASTNINRTATYNTLLEEQHASLVAALAEKSAAALAVANASTFGAPVGQHGMNKNEERKVGPVPVPLSGAEKGVVLPPASRSSTESQPPPPPSQAPRPRSASLSSHACLPNIFEGSLLPMERTRSAPSAALIALTANAEAANAAEGALVADALMQRDASLVDLSSPETAAMLSQARARLGGRPLSDRLVQDLLRLARHKMLGPEGSNSSHVRVPTDVLAGRTFDRVEPVREEGARAQAGGLLFPTIEADAATSTRRLEVTIVPGGPFANATHEDVDDAAHDASARDENGKRCMIHAAQEHSFRDEAVLFVGVIDWLQPYNARKRMERSFKGIVQDAKGVSVQDPATYAKRFMAFMSKVFVSASNKPADL